jgi:hypothetical protein
LDFYEQIKKNIVGLVNLFFFGSITDAKGISAGEYIMFDQDNSGAAT